MRRSPLLPIFLALWCAVAPAWAGGGKTLGEYDLKAAFLINFVRYAEWTAVKTSTPNYPLVIGVLGKNPFGDKLGKLAAQAKIHGRDVKVVEIRSLDDLRGSEVVFLASHDRAEAARALAALREKGILTIGDSPRSAEWGAVLAFVPEESKIRFAVNQSAARGQGIKISSKLLQLAVEVLP